MMQIFINCNDAEYAIDLNSPLDISIPVYFDGLQPNTYGVPVASARAYEDGKFVGDVRRGGSCNFEEYRIVPHCNGTHTECVGHIS
ncbi:MAG TPA: cyclase family protein, partial [bacterium]|nr:cyclase family protein [bacterium]